MSTASSAALSFLSRHVKAQPLSVLYRLTADYRLPPSPRLASLVHGQTVRCESREDAGLALYPDGSLDVYAPFFWDGSSPRVALRVFGRVLLSVGTPNGPKVAGGMRAATRGSMVHDRLCRSAPLLADALCVQEQSVYDAADLVLLDIVSEDWSPWWGRRFYAAVRTFGDAYRAATG